MDVSALFLACLMQMRMKSGGAGGGVRQNKFKGNTMLYYTLVFLVVAIIAGVLGFGGIAGTAASIAKVLFVIFLVLFLVALIKRKK